MGSKIEVEPQSPARVGLSSDRFPGDSSGFRPRAESGTAEQVLPRFPKGALNGCNSRNTDCVRESSMRFAENALPGNVREFPQASRFPCRTLVRASKLAFIPSSAPCRSQQVCLMEGVPAIGRPGLPSAKSGRNLMRMLGWILRPDKLFLRSVAGFRTVSRQRQPGLTHEHSPSGAVLLRSAPRRHQ